MVVVSVIIAAYNAGKYLEETLESVLSQTYPDIECIFVDDGSTDNTASIVSRYGRKLKYIYQSNAERSAARNNGLSHCSGKYVNFVDADDVIAPDKIADQVAYLERHLEFDAVYSKVRYFRDNGNRSFYDVPRPTPEGDILGTLIYGNFINLGSPLIRKAALDRINGFDAGRPDIILNEDWDLWLRFAISGAQFGFIDKVHLFYRVHGENTSKNRLRSIEAKKLVAENVIRQYQHLLELKGIDCLRVLESIKAEYGRMLILSGRVKEGRDLIKTACKTNILHKRYLQLFSLASRIVSYRFLAAVQHIRNKEL